MKSLRIIGLIAFSLISTAQIHAQTIFEQSEITGVEASDLGTSVVLENGFIAKGVPFDNTGFGETSGAVYIYDANTGAFLRKIIPADSTGFDRFGVSVDIDQNLLVVGARFHFIDGVAAGAAYVFDITTGMQVSKLVPDVLVQGQQFGSSVAIDNGIAVVGSYDDPSNGFQSGAAFLFDASTGVQSAKLYPEDGGFQDRFGTSVAIDSGVVAVGAPRGGTLNGGAVYTFDATTGIQTEQYEPDGSSSSSMFGFAIAMDDGLLVASAPKDQINGDDSGSAYIFDMSTGVMVSKLVPLDGESRDGFGGDVSNNFTECIAIDNGLVVVSAYFNRINGMSSGSAHLFDANTGEHLNILVPRDRINGQRCLSVSIKNDTIVMTGRSGVQTETTSVFVYETADCYADTNRDSGLNFLDIQEFIQTLPDWNMDGRYNYFDIVAFLQAYMAGCP